MTHYFLESSAFAKLFIAEAGSDALIDLMEQVADVYKLVSPLAFIEVRSAVRRRERLGDITAGDADYLLVRLSAEQLRLVEQPLNPSVLEMARSALDRHPLRALDALHLATCLVARDILGISSICFVSSDVELLEAAEAEDFETLDPTMA